VAKQQRKIFERAFGHNLRQNKKFT